MNSTGGLFRPEAVQEAESGTACLLGIFGANTGFFFEARNAALENAQASTSTSAQ